MQGRMVFFSHFYCLLGHRWSQMNSANLYGGGNGGVCVLAHACARIRGHACVRDMFAIHDNNI